MIETTRHSRNPVRLVPFDPRWADAFRRIADGLADALAPCLSGIEHIGSTSVPGMLAKPVIDVDVTLRSLADIEPATDILLSLGYEARGNRYDDGMWAFSLRDQKPMQRIYLCAPGNRTHLRRIAFRDHLIAHEDVAEAYAALKTRLAAEFENDGDGYTAAKGDFIDAVVRRALQRPGRETD